MKTQVTMLKVKIKSLTEEARIIRKEERRSGWDRLLQSRLHEHRVRDLRKEQRAAFLAYAFLRGRSVNAVEPHSRVPPDWSRVRKLIEKFGTTSYAPAVKEEQARMVEEWINAALTRGR